MLQQVPSFSIPCFSVDMPFCFNDFYCDPLASQNTLLHSLMATASSFSKRCPIFDTFVTESGECRFQHSD